MTSSCHFFTHSLTGHQAGSLAKLCMLIESGILAHAALQIFFKEEHKKGRQYKDLYELVQHAGNVLPRM